MPERRVRHLATVPDPDRDAKMRKVNGMLYRLNAEHVGGHRDKLPPAAEGAASPQYVTIPWVPGLGPVRVRYELREFRHYKHGYWSWCATWADEVCLRLPVVVLPVACWR